MARYENYFSICNTATLTLIVLMLQITKRSKEQYLDTLAAHNCDKDSFLLLEFLSVSFSLLVIMLQTYFSLSDLLP